MTPAILLMVCAAVALGAWVATWAALEVLTRHGVYDRPNPRSSHDAPRPRGGGLALMPVLLAAWTGLALWSGGAPDGFWIVLAGAALLAVVSWIDDLRSLSAISRLMIQGAAVALGLAGLGEAGLVFQGLLPPVLDRVATALLWIWFVNLFNFMDGIDGITGVEAISLGLGLALVAWLAGWAMPMLSFPALLAAATLGFLVWNWAPARLFLGDVGSVPLGYLLGWLLLLAAIKGQWAAALILPLYYLADATITLGRRAVQGAKVWQAHRDHFYQRAVRRGASHARVSTQILVCNALLLTLAAAAAMGYILPALAGAALVVAILLLVLARGGGRPI